MDCKDCDKRDDCDKKGFQRKSVLDLIGISDKEADVIAEPAYAALKTEPNIPSFYEKAFRKYAHDSDSIRVFFAGYTFGRIIADNEGHGRVRAMIGQILEDSAGAIMVGSIPSKKPDEPNARVVKERKGR